MKRVARWLGYGLGAILTLALLAAGWIWLQSARIYHRAYAPTAEALPAPGTARLAEGQRLIRILGCVDCHGEGLRGRLMFDIPNVAKVWAPNLTLIVPRLSDAQLDQAIRQGIGEDGQGLWIMPSGLFSRLSGEEVAAVIAAMRSAPRGGTAQPDMQIGPLARLGIATGKFKPAPELIADFRLRQPLRAGGRVEHGRLIAAKVCADCHGPDLGGGQPGFDRTPPDLTVASAYGLEEFRRLLRTGRSVGGRDLGLMRQAAVNGLSALSDEEITALHAYLKARAERIRS